MNDDALRRLLRNSLLGRKAPAALWERVSARLRGTSRRPLALTLFAFAAILAAAGLKLALRPAAAPAEPPAVAAAPALPSWLTAALEQHRGTSDIFKKTPPMAPRELTERIREQSGFFVDLPGLREAGFEPRDVHRCLDKGFAHVIYANNWSKLSCFLFEEGLVPFGEAGRPLEVGEGRIYDSDDASVVAVKDGPVVKVWVSELRPAHLRTIALNAEKKRDCMRTTVLAGVKGSAPQAVEAFLRGIPGVEDVTIETVKREAYVQFDERQVSEDAIGAVATSYGVADGMRDWGAEGR